VGYCHWRETERIFAVDRIREVRALGMRFTVRPGFDAEKYLKHVWGIVKGEIVPVKLIFSRSVARYIRDRLWHPSQEFRELPEGRLELRLRVADTLEVRRWILGYGPDAEVVEPAALRDALRSSAQILVERLSLRRKGLARTHSKSGQTAAVVS
jgi:predicted DNA-binding transcriptional regulator YafY